MTIREYAAPEGITFRIADRADGQFAVTLHDDDSGETLPTIKIYPTLDMAETYVRKAISLAG